MGMMQGLDPVMETTVNDLNKVTDFSIMNKLNDKWDINHGHDFGNISAPGSADLDASESEGDKSDADSDDDAAK